MNLDKSILFFSDMTVSSAVRQEMLAKELDQRGWNCHIVSLTDRFSIESLAGFSYYHFIRPLAGVPDLMGACKNHHGGILIVDLDDDFKSIPAHHPGYKYVGQGNPEAIKALEQGIAIADIFTVSTDVIGERYRTVPAFGQEFIKEPFVIPNGWSSSNTLWKRRERRDYINITIGWAGTITHREDFRPCERALKRLLSEDPRVNLLIGTDEEIYKLFKDIAPRRKTFIPQVPYYDYPWIPSHCDIWLAPLKNDRFNQAKSDIKLVDAGAAGIPWVASPVKPYQDWSVGGCFAESENEYYDALRTLVNEPLTAMALGDDGYQKAQSREAARIADLWEEVIKENLYANPG